MKKFVDDLAVTFDEIVGTPDTTTINPNEKTPYWLMAVSFVLLLMVYLVKYCMKVGLTVA